MKLSHGKAIVVLNVLILLVSSFHLLFAVAQEGSLSFGGEEVLQETITENLDNPQGSIPETKPSEPVEFETTSPSAPVQTGSIPAGSTVSANPTGFSSSLGDFLTRSGANINNGDINARRDGTWSSQSASRINDGDAQLTSPSSATGNNKELTAQQAKHISISNKLMAINIVNFHYDKIINTITFDSADNVHLFHPLPMSFPSLGKTTLTFNGNTLTEFTTDVLNTLTIPHPFNDLPLPDYLQFKDSDGDGLVDEIETLNNLNPNNPDSDGDGLSDYDEFTRYPTNPNDANTYGQTDSQALDDIRAGTLVLGQNQGSTIADLGLTPFTAFQDSDGDGLSDWKEFSLGTDRNNPDSDGDGLTDGYELTHALGPRETTSMFVPQERVQEMGPGTFSLDLTHYKGNTPSSVFITTRNDVSKKHTKVS